MMKQAGIFVLLLVTILGTYAAYEPGLKIKFGLGLGAGSTYHYSIPRYQQEIIDLGWTVIERDSEAPLPTLPMYCPADDFTFCAIYDEDTGYIAGIQIAIAVENFTNTIPSDLTQVGFKKWSAPAPVGGYEAEYWIQYQFFITEDILRLRAEERTALHPNNETLYGGGLWLPDVHGSLTKVSLNETEMAATPYKIQGCIPGMGQHYFYNITSDSDDSVCASPYPWFTLTKDGTLIASGLTVYGTLADIPEGKRNWYEQASRTVVETVIPYAPECIYDQVDSPGLVTMHVFYIEHPWYVWFC